MPVISDTALRIKLSDGNMAVVLVSPHHMPRDEIAESRRWPAQYGKQIAHSVGDKWFSAASGEEITDARTISLLERAPDMDLAVPLTQFRCPDDERHTGDVVGCGQVFEAVPDDEGFVDCPHCGMFFKAEQGALPSTSTN